jgi:hypothetical protein
MLKRTLFFALLLSILLPSCKKVEGVGGKATIKGKVYVKNYVGTTLTSEFYGADYDVYIIYGEDNTFYDDNVKTSYDGSFEFRYLRPGIYKVFAYTDDSSSPSGQSEVMTIVEIDGKKDIIEIEDLVIKD